MIYDDEEGNFLKLIGEPLPDFKTVGEYAEFRHSLVHFPSDEPTLQQDELIDYFKTIMPEGWEILWFRVRNHRNACLSLIASKVVELNNERMRLRSISQARMFLELQYVIDLVKKKGPI